MYFYGFQRISKNSSTSPHNYVEGSTETAGKDDPATGTCNGIIHGSSSYL